MTTKHTPLYLRAIDLEGAGIDLRFVCTGDEEINEQARRNAHLIAAAPDLLEALEFAREKIAELHAEAGDGDCHYPIIDDAIAKATGMQA